jgi:hypothetical protein
MAKMKKGKYVTADGFAYLDKRTLLAKAQSAGMLAATNAMEEMGYVVVLDGVNIVKKYKNGQLEILGQVAH